MGLSVVEFLAPSASQLSLNTLVLCTSRPCVLHRVPLYTQYYPPIPIIWFLPLRSPSFLHIFVTLM